MLLVLNIYCKFRVGKQQEVTKEEEETKPDDPGLLHALPISTNGELYQSLSADARLSIVE
jgi:hypothetical protein